MLRRHILATAAASFAAPAIVSRASLGQNLRKVKMGSAFTTTTNAAFLMPALLKPEGIDLELVMFPSLVQRMQAVASGDVAAATSHHVSNTSPAPNATPVNRCRIDSAIEIGRAHV